MSHAKDRAAERKAKAAAVIAAHRRRDRRRAVIAYSSLILVAAAVFTAVALVIAGTAAERSRAAEAARAPIDGVQSYAGLGRDHVETATFAQEPGAGGDHAPTWTNCGTYTAPVEESRAVHSLEHGAVWISYRPDLPAEQVRALTDLAKDRAYVLLSPNPRQAAPVDATAWGTQLALDTAGDPRLPAFVAKYTKGPQAPEPGASCTGGVNG